ncbi:histidine phosphatase family protein [bacterium]|nr:histidine phosphatase family protein [bacterium]
MATRIIFVRHGVTELNNLGVIQGAAKTPLTDFGRRQADSAAKALKAFKPVALYSSPYVRAMQTAEIIGKHLELPVIESTRLREQGLGEWEGRAWKDISAADPQIAQRRSSEGWWFCPPGGEPRLRVRHRMLAFVSEMAERHTDATVVAVTHAGSMYFLVHALIEKVPMGRTHIHFFNCGFSAVKADSERMSLISLNEIAHLQGLEED